MLFCIIVNVFMQKFAKPTTLDIAKKELFRRLNKIDSF